MVILFNKWLLALMLSGLGVFDAGSKHDLAVHPYHVSATEIEYNTGENRLEITSKIFTDDFENVLKKIYKTKADFADKNFKKQMDELVKRYITTHLAIRSHSTLMPMQLYGWEQQGEAVYIYTTANAAGFDAKNITVENIILYDLFDDQMNIIHFIVGKQRQSSRLNFPERKLHLKFD